PVDEIMAIAADVLAPSALGATLNATSIEALKVAIVAGAANNQLATPADGARVHARGILYAPDYVINAGGIINVSTEYLGSGDAEVVTSRIAKIEGRLADIFVESDRTDTPTDVVADRMAQKLIGR
ncbi:MAG: amino acid dehydrogenase, partial [Sphingomonadaceae bacterium]|nr:amino acid dehydrogenase [Sphingomonadaceae bacterium]